MPDFFDLPDIDYLPDIDDLPTLDKINECRIAAMKAGTLCSGTPFPAHFGSTRNEASTDSSIAPRVLTTGRRNHIHSHHSAPNWLRIPFTITCHIQAKTCSEITNIAQQGNWLLVRKPHTWDCLIVKGAHSWFYGEYKVTMPWNETGSLLVLEYIPKAFQALKDELRLLSSTCQFKDPEKYSSLFRDALSVLDTAHKRKIQHRDIREENTISDDTPGHEQVVLIDWHNDLLLDIYDIEARMIRNDLRSLKLTQARLKNQWLHPSPVHELLAHTKHPFPSSYLHFFDQEYEDLLSTVITLDAEYATMYARLQGFDRIRQMLKTRLNEYRGIRHPIRRLPDEMLAMVFRLCVDNGISDRMTKSWKRGGDSSNYPGSLNTTKSPWVLTHRLILYGGLNLTRLKNITQLSKLSCRHNSRGATNDLSIAYFDAYFGFGNPEGFQPSSYSEFFPNLTTLHVHFEQWTCDVFRVAPALRKLTITGIHDIVGDRSFLGRRLPSMRPRDDEEL
uniref:Putative serine/threonine kinase, SPS1 n=1 Tax=Moniliophthora roreri TaxID=221103 RepID=A0A0W0FQI0_MONRR